MLFMAGVTAFGQIPANAAGDSIQKRVQGIDLLHAPPSGLRMRVAKADGLGSGYCSIPLIEARPAGTEDRIPVLNPRDPVAGIHGDVIAGPAPPCTK